MNSFALLVLITALFLIVVLSVLGGVAFWRQAQQDSAKIRAQVKQGVEEEVEALKISYESQRQELEGLRLQNERVQEEMKTALWKQAQVEFEELRRELHERTQRLAQLERMVTLQSSYISLLLNQLAEMGIQPTQPPPVELTAWTANSLHEAEVRHKEAVLLAKIDRRFSEEELRDLAHNLGTDYDNLPGRTKLSKARELVDFMRRRERMPDLINALRTLRPATLWNDW